MVHIRGEWVRFRAGQKYFKSYWPSRSVWNLEMIPTRLYYLFFIDSSIFIRKKFARALALASSVIQFFHIHVEIVVRNIGDGSFIIMVYSTCSFTYLYDLIMWDWSFSDKDGIPINRYLHSESSSWLYRSCLRWHSQAKRCGFKHNNKTWNRNP